MIIGNKNILNSAISLQEALLKEAVNTKYNKIILASAFLTEKAVEELKDFLNQVIAKEIIFIIGTKQHFTSPNAIKKLLDLANTYNNIQVKLPLDPEFHLKCYYFSLNLIPLNSRELKNNNFFFIGSGNLTDSGLDSQSELLIKVSDTETVNAVSTYLESITKNSIDWNLEIRRYTENYNNQNIKIVNYQPFIPHKGIINKNIKHLKIENAARTVDIIEKADSDEEKFAKESFNLLSEEYPNLNKDNWVVFSGLSKEEIEQRQCEYKIGSYFDREDGYNGSGWDIGSKRKICKVGAFYVDTEKGLCILFRENRKVIPYVVTQEVINKAEELGIKGGDDQGLLPTKKDMNKYIEFINTIRKREK